MGLNAIVKGFIIFFVDLYNIFFGVLENLISMVPENQYSFDVEPVYYLGQSINMLIIFFLIIGGLGISLWILNKMCEFILDNALGTSISGVSISVSLALIVEGLGIKFGIVTNELIVILPETIAFILIFLSFYWTPKLLFSRRDVQ